MPAMPITQSSHAKHSNSHNLLAIDGRESSLDPESSLGVQVSTDRFGRFFPDPLSYCGVPIGLISVLCFSILLVGS